MAKAVTIVFSGYCAAKEKCIMKNPPQLLVTGDVVVYRDGLSWHRGCYDGDPTDIISLGD